MNVIEVTLSDKRVMRVREPKASEIAIVSQTGAALEKMKTRAGFAEMTQKDNDRMVNIIARLTDETDDAIGELGLSDFYALVVAMSKVAGEAQKSPLAKKTRSPSSASKRA